MTQKQVKTGQLIPEKRPKTAKKRPKQPKRDQQVKGGLEIDCKE